MTTTSHAAIDASVHIFPRSDADLRSYMREPFASRGFPVADVAWFAPPGNQVRAGDRDHRRHPPDVRPRCRGPHPLRRATVRLRRTASDVGGVMPHRHLETAILAATNTMMVERWLESGTYADRFRGTVRVDPNDVEGAVAEIDRWKDHPRVVQIGLPLQTPQPYGHPQYKPPWRAACDAGLPIAVRIEMGAGVTHPPRAPA